MEGTRAVGLGHGGAEEGDDVAATKASRYVEGRHLASRDGGISAHFEEVRDNVDMATITGIHQWCLPMFAGE